MLIGELTPSNKRAIKIYKIIKSHFLYKGRYEAIIENNKRNAVAIINPKLA